MVYKIFVINLERCKDKKERIIKRLKGEDYEIFKAYDGRQLNDEKLEQLGAKVLKEWKDPYSGRNATWGEAGCALSHYSVMEKCVQENIEVAVILEDDVIVPNNFSEHINDCLASLNKIDDWEFCYLGRKAMRQNEDISYNEKFLKPGYSYWLCAYIINLKGMKKVVNSGMKENLITPDEVLPIIAKSSPYTDFYKFYNIQEPLKMYSLVNLSCKPEPNAFKFSDTENSKEIDTCNDKLLLLATGTDMTDGLKRFIKSCKTYGLKYKIMGMNTTWNGGNMIKEAGGGQKINLLLDTLNELKDEQLILVTDSYDVIMSANTEEIVEKYKEFNKKIVFASESSCWPDRNIAHKFPKIKGRSNIYLNSGGFIGDVASIKKIVSTVPGNSDDQRWYTQMFLNEPGKEFMTLDYDCKIFQCLNNAETELSINFSRSRIYNKHADTFPCQIHGNGGASRKLKLNQYENYLIKNRTGTYGYNYKNDIDIKSKASLTIYIQFTNEDNSNLMNEKVKIYIDQNIDELRKVMPDNANIHIIFSDCSDLNKGLEEALTFGGIDYYWLVDTDFVITNKNTLCDLITRNKGIITPLLCKPELRWSNFWGEITPNGWYQSSFDYADIVEYDKKGSWNVPHIAGNILIEKEYIEKVQGYFKNTSNNMNFSVYMCFSYNCRKNNVFMYVTNMDNYGYIYDSEQDNITDQVINKSLFMYESNPELWAKTYLHPDFLKCIDDLDKLQIEEPCKWAFKFPFVNDKFCNELLDEVNRRGDWSTGNNSKTKDNRINNVENFPTQDIHMKQIGFREQWGSIVKRFIAPVVSHLFAPFKTNGLNIAFVVKYEMGKQQKLNPHHDSSAYTINIALNTPGVDFTGGGTRFIKQDTTVQGEKGWVIIHPGRLTHYHEGISISSGKRYIFVSFVN